MNSIILRQPEARELYAEGAVTILRDVKPQPMGEFILGDRWEILFCNKCPYPLGAALKVREAYVIESNYSIDDNDAYPPPFSDGRPVHWLEDSEGCYAWEQCHYKATDPLTELYRDDGSGYYSDGYSRCHWLSAATMPLWASRSKVEVVSVDVVQSEGRWQWKIKLEKVRDE